MADSIEVLLAALERLVAEREADAADFFPEKKDHAFQRMAVERELARASVANPGAVQKVQAGRFTVLY